VLAVGSEGGSRRGSQAGSDGYGDDDESEEEVEVVAGCLEQLEALVVHDKAVMECHNGLLFKRVELGLKKLLVEKRLNGMGANMREKGGDGGDGQVYYSTEGAQYSPEDLDSGEADGGGAGAKKVAKALAHYHGEAESWR
jgi:hypothetical protein